MFGEIGWNCRSCNLWMLKLMDSAELIFIDFFASNDVSSVNF